MFPTHTLISRLRILVISRIFIAAFFLFYAQFVFPIQELIFYSVIVATVFLSAFYVIWLSLGRGLKVLAWFQILWETFQESTKEEIEVVIAAREEESEGKEEEPIEKEYVD